MIQENESKCISSFICPSLLPLLISSTRRLQFLDALIFNLLPNPYIHYAGSHPFVLLCHCCQCWLLTFPLRMSAFIPRHFWSLLIPCVNISAIIGAKGNTATGTTYLFCVWRTRHLHLLITVSRFHSRKAPAGGTSTVKKDSIQFSTV